MTVAIREIFIASNFEEFGPLRAALRERINSSSFARAIDLGQNQADPRSVEELSLGRVRSADLAVILIGERYGRGVDGKKLSYTHLEYRAARAEKVPVLPYFIGAHVSRSGVVEACANGVEEVNLRVLKREIMAKHVVSFHPPSDPGQLADAIFDRVREFFLETRRDAEVADEDDGDLDAIGQPPGEDFFSLNRQGKSLEDALSRSQIQVLQRPARTAAVEQLLEARRAYDIGDREAAILHFRRALEFRPLGFEAGYSLSRLLVTSTQVRHRREASRLARRMARIAGSEGHSVGEALALAVAARAELSQGNEDRAVELVREAIDAAETRASVRVEGAAIYAAVGLISRAIEQARRAFMLRPESFLRLQRDPVLRKNGEFRALSSELEATVRDHVQDLRKVYRDSLALEVLLLPGEQSPEQEQSADNEPQSGSALIRNVRIGRALGKDILESLRGCALGLLCLRDELEHHRAGAAALRSNDVARSTTPVGVLLGGVLSILLSVITMIAWMARVEWRWAVLLLLCVSSAITAFLYLGQRARRREQIDAANSMDRQLQAKLESSAESFLRAVHDFERAAVHPLSGMFSPTVGPHRAQLGKDVRLRIGEPRAQAFTLEMGLIPPELGLQLVSSGQPDVGAQVFRVVRRDGGKWLASKAACYFGDELRGPRSTAGNGRAVAPSMSRADVRWTKVDPSPNEREEAAVVG